MKIERQLAWPCRDCPIRSKGFCSALIANAPSIQPVRDQALHQTFFTAKKSEIVPPFTEQRPAGPYVLCHGFAYRIHRFRDGRRQILAVLIPGDVIHLSALAGAAPDFEIEAASELRLCELRTDDVKHAVAVNAGAADALGKLFADESEEQMAMVVNLSERNPLIRVADFIHRIVKRLDARGLAQEDVYPFPPTAHDIADAVALSVSDVNRAIESLQQDGRIELSNGELRVMGSLQFKRSHLPIASYEPATTPDNSAHWLS